MVRPLKSGSYLKIGNWSVFVLFGWRFVFGMIMRWEGRVLQGLARFKEGESVIRLSLGRRLVNLLPLAQRTNAFTNGVVDRPWVVGREFESHVHHENAF